MPSKSYDVLIIGSGHAGGMAAYALARKGISCLMLNAGPAADLQHDRSPIPAYQLPYRGLTQPGLMTDNSFSPYVQNAFVHQEEVPYTYDADKPYPWARSRLVGGRSIFWGGQSFRLSDLEFKSRDFDGYGDNWPISLSDLAPYYDRVEQLYRVVGRPDGLSQYPDSKFTTTLDQPDSPLIRHLAPYMTQRGMVVSADRRAKGVNGLCSSINLTLPDALASGHLTIVADAVVREIRLDPKTGLAGEVYFVERHTRRELSVKARAVVLAASTLESTRILLNSGIANSSGVLGHYLFDNLYGGTCYSEAPRAELATGKVAVPPFRNVSPETRSKNFIGRYILYIGAAGAGFGGGELGPDTLCMYGTELDAWLKEHGDRIVGGTIMGETLPRFENHVRINKDVSDSWGIPVLHISAAYGDNERKLHQDAQDTAAELYGAAGFKLIVKNPTRREPGQSIHEVGTCRMGDNPKTSVLNKWNQSHDVKNLFVVDGGAFVSGGWQNPTLTITALSMRASEYLAEQLRQGNL